MKSQTSTPDQFLVQTSSRSRLRTQAPVAGILLAALVLVGCSRETYHVSFQMAPYHAATLRVHGDHPFVTITNGGLGTVQLTYADSGEQTLAQISTGRTMRNRDTVRIETAGEAADIAIKAQHAEGYELLGPLPKN